MNHRIDRQQNPSKQAIPARSEPALACRPDATPDSPAQSASNWLSSAMAIWIEQDEMSEVCQDATHATT